MSSRNGLSKTVHNMIDSCIIRSNCHLEQQIRSSHLRLRRALKQDVKQIMKLVQGLAIYEKEPESVHVDIDTYLRDGFETFPLFYCLLLEDTKTSSPNVCGMGFFYFGYSTWDGPFLYLADLFIEEQYRGLGGGKCIMYTLADIAQSLSCSRFVWQTSDWNKPARDFYDSIGTKTLHGWLTLRLEKTSIAQFLNTRPGITNAASKLVHPQKEICREVVWDTIDECLSISNEQLKNRPQTSDFNLRRATKTDVDSIMSLVQGLAIYEKEPESVHVDIDTYLRDGFGSSPLFYCLLLEKTQENGNPQTEKKACGMGFFYFGYSTWDGPFLYLEDLFIEEQYRGLGGGKCIMYTLADIAQSLSCSRFVWQALDWNKPARDFYDSIGTKTLHGCLTLRLEKTSIAQFLNTRPDIMDQESRI